MSLVSLKKPARSVEPALAKRSEAIDIDSFIDDAVVYANGGVINENHNVVAFCHKHPEVTRKSPLKRATFTLGEEAINQLADIAIDANMSKSKWLRTLIAEHSIK